MDKEIISKSIDGCLYVSEDVIAGVIAKAAEGVDGVAGIAGSAHNPLRLLLAKRNHGRIRFKLDGDVLSVAVGLVLEKDAAAVEAAEKVQAAIKDQVQNVLGLTVARVNVNLLDVVV